MYLISDQRSGRVATLAALDADVLVQTLTPPSTVGLLREPSGLSLDDQGRIIVADTSGARVAVFALTTGTWTAFGSGQLDRPSSVAVDDKGRILVADTRRVIRVDDEHGAGLVEVLGPQAGRRPVAVATGPMGIAALDWQGGAVLISDDGGSTWATHLITPAARPARPVAMWAAADGSLLITDVANARVMTMAPDGAVQTLVDGTHGLVAPVGAVSDGIGIIVADAGPGWVRRYLPVGNGWEPADFVRGRRPDGSYRFDRIGGLAIGELV